jgi:hypothetical protein
MIKLYLEFFPDSIRQNPAEQCILIPTPEESHVIEYSVLNLIKRTPEGSYINFHPPNQKGIHD